MSDICEIFAGEDIVNMERELIWRAGSLFVYADFELIHFVLAPLPIWFV